MAIGSFDNDFDVDGVGVEGAASSKGPIFCLTSPNSFHSSTSAKS